MAEPAREWYEVDAITVDFPNLEAALEAARERLGESGPGATLDVYRVTRTPVRCVRREVSITETDIPEPRESVAE
ncbi:hypothetical protein [Streptomyces sp. t39]|uniref:hypothetical protein n=1 Tax=Streptomyces sp. t39 TaxID=1828156 RepID=UPI0011CD5086|nr:hypothetical protein [Streptomyces sp. t39]TXS35080.1 hypothetical protein EAO77_37935 [Streptomyces sp. t39]